MAEFAAMSVAATLAAAGINVGSGFTRRHEESHQKEIMETRRIVEDFKKDPPSGIPPEKKSKFRETKTEADRKGNEYHEKIESYKSTSWFNLPKKLKRKEDVRRAKRAIMRSNNLLRNRLEEMRLAADLVEPSSFEASEAKPFSEAGQVEDEATEAWRK